MGGAQHFEAALWEARGRLADELLVGYPRAIVLGRIADRLASAFGGYGGRELGGAVSLATGHRTRRLRVVAGSGVVSLLGQAYELSLVWKNDDYEAWSDCQTSLRRLFVGLLPMVREVEYAVEGAEVLERVVATASELEAAGVADELRTQSSEDYVPRDDAGSSVGGDCERRFHYSDRMDAYRHRRLAAAEYDEFRVWLVETAGQGDLCSAFRDWLRGEYASGRYPGRPVAPVYGIDGASAPVSSLRRDGGSSRSTGGRVGVEGLSQGGALSPSVYTGMVVRFGLPVPPVQANDSTGVFDRARRGGAVPLVVGGTGLPGGPGEESSDLEDLF